MKLRPVLIWSGQIILAVLVIRFLGRTVVTNWSELSDLNVALRLRPGWILLAAVIIWVTYGLLVTAWRWILGGWGQRLPFGRAAQIWCLSNLGRYLPGKIWSIAGLAVLSQRAGVVGWAAAASAVAMQVLAVGTGAVIVALSAPGAASPVLDLVGIPPTAAPILLGTAGVVALATVTGLTLEPLSAAAGRAAGPKFQLRALPLRTVVAAGATTLVSWLAYGVAFWFLARGLFGAGDLTVQSAVGVFAAGYIVGLLALFVPGGVGVRELVFLALLSPVLGPRGALALTIASRLLLTGTEVSAALLTLGLRADQGGSS
ncbi:MAG: flippase-like domain-containing protein [Gemmatimonadota bacterium]|nr:MAG: flippase-like domain-containing protein [Gemmatimonadota bacterium]